MQANAIRARTRDNSPNSTSAARTGPAVSRTMAECRNRSGHGEKTDEEEASTVIGTAVSSVPDLYLGRLSRHALWFGRRPFEGGRHLAKALRSRPDDNLPKRQQDYGQKERRKIVQDTKQQHAGEQVFLVHLPEADQQGGIEHAEPSRGMTGEAKQCRRDEDYRHDDETEVRLVRDQHVHCQRTKAEGDDPDGDLQQGTRTAG